MIKLTENRDCYFYPQQRDILIEFFKNETIRENFFLTGGTALSVFYFHHRKSNDLDLFSIDRPQFSDIDYWVKKRWQEKYSRFKMEPYTWSAEVDGVKVDLVHDPVSLKDEKPTYAFGNDTIVIDSIDNIASNKLCTLVSRQEPKDFIDFYFIGNMASPGLDSIYLNAQKKEGMFDDPPMVAYQIENNLAAIKQNPYAFPEMIVEFDLELFSKFYEDLAQQIYHMKLK